MVIEYRYLWPADICENTLDIVPFQKFVRHMVGILQVSTHWVKNPTIPTKYIDIKYHDFVFVIRVHSNDIVIKLLVNGRLEK